MLKIDASTIAHMLDTNQTIIKSESRCTCCSEPMDVSFTYLPKLTPQRKHIGQRLIVEGTCKNCGMKLVRRASWLFDELVATNIPGFKLPE